DELSGRQGAGDLRCFDFDQPVIAGQVLVEHHRRERLGKWHVGHERSAVPFVSRMKSAVSNIKLYDTSANRLIASDNGIAFETYPTRNGNSPPIARPAL